MIITVSLVAVMVFFSTIGNLLIKLGVSKTRPGLFLNWWVIIGLGLFVASFAIYIFLLRRVSLNVAQSLLASQFITVILGSYFILHEPLSNLRIFGVSMIALGILIVAYTNTTSP